MDMENIVRTTSAHEERLKNLEDYQKKQNGHLEKIEKKLDTIYDWLIKLLGGAIVSLILLLLRDVILK
jgi:hypothetical protein